MSTLFLVKETDWYYSFIDIEHYLTRCAKNNKVPVTPHKSFKHLDKFDPLYDIYSKYAFDWRSGARVSRGHSCFDLSKGKDYIAQYNRDNDVVSENIILKVEKLDEQVDLMISAYNNRANKDALSLKFDAQFADDDFSHYNSYVMRKYVNNKLKENYLRFTGNALQSLVRKPKNIDQTEIDLKREEIFNRLFSERRIDPNEETRWNNNTSIAINCLTEAIGLTEDIQYDKVNSAVIKRIITKRCYNEVLYAKLSGTDDICEAFVKSSLYTPDLKIARKAILKRRFIEVCDNEDADLIFDDLVAGFDKETKSTKVFKKLCEDLIYAFERHTIGVE